MLFEGSGWSRGEEAAVASWLTRVCEVGHVRRRVCFSQRLIRCECIYTDTFGSFTLGR
jgi:hypothetical protein